MNKIKLNPEVLNKNSCKMNIKNIIVSFLTVTLLFSTLAVNASIVVLNGLSHEIQLQPGGTYRGSIQLKNTGPGEKSVRIYQRDFWYNYGGESRHDEAGTMARSNAHWITYTPELLTLDSAEVTTVNFEIKPPANDSLRGTYWSVFMVEGINEPDTSNVKTGVRVKTAIRYAVQIITNVGDTGNSDLQFLGMELVKQEEDNVLNVAVENTGECLLRPAMSLELFDESGNSFGTIKANGKRTLPGTSVLASLPLKGILPGKYNGVLVADCGDDRLYGTNLSIEIE